MHNHLVSRYVVSTGGVLYNTMTQETLAEDADVELLRKHLFLAGQERDALEKRLFSPPGNELSLRILPTWECNLRCNHCCVLGLLKAKDECKIQPKDIVRFCVAHKKKYSTERINLSFLGGECLIKTQECLEIIAAVVDEFGDDKVQCSLTTNLAMDLDEQHLLLLSKCYMDVSLDGTEDQHNWQRKSSDRNLNPYRKTLCNIARLIKLGLVDKITVQSAIQQEVYDENKKREFYRELMKIGVKKIIYGTCYPTRQNPEPDKIYLDCLKSPRLIKKICCDYRFMKLFTINSNNEIVGDYFGLAKTKPFDLGGFGSSYDMAHIEKSYEDKIRGRLNILRDKTCLDECPVVAYCWGGCQNSEFVANEPSKNCDRESLKKVVDVLARNGGLIQSSKVSGCGGSS